MNAQTTAVPTPAIVLDPNTSSITLNGSPVVTASGLGNSFLAALSGSGNVGIGTTTPNYKLDVNGSTHVTLPSNNSGSPSFVIDNTYGDGNILEMYARGRMTLNNNANNTGFTINSGNNGVLHTLLSLNGGSGQSGNLQEWAVSGTTLDVITAAGRLGIGTQNPNRKLYIAENVNGLTYALKLDDYNSGNAATGILFGVGGNGNSGLDENRGKGALVYSYVPGTWNYGDFHFLQNATSGFAVASLADSVMTIRYNGNVGIGTTTPSVKLDVNGALSITGTSNLVGSASLSGTNNLMPNQKLTGTSSVLTQGLADTRYVKTDQTGNVGIGTQYPTDNFEIYGPSVFSRLARSSGSGYALTRYFTSGSEDWTTGTRANDSGYYIRDASGDVNLYAQQGGNVGIGTSSPSSILTVQKSFWPYEPAVTINNTDNEGFLGISLRRNGTEHASFGIFDEANANRAFIGTNNASIVFNPGGGVWVNSSFMPGGEAFAVQGTSYVSSNSRIGGALSVQGSDASSFAGNVGIGTTTPATKLDVVGNANFSGVVRVTEQGDLSMGEFTQEPQ
jgi:hypothetical protein